MSKNPISAEEINNLVNFFEEKKQAGILAGMISVRELLPLIDPSDQTKERINKLLAPRLEGKGIFLITKGLNFEFSIKDSVPVDQKPLSGKTMANDTIVEASGEWVSKPTRLNHNFVPNGEYGDIRKAVSLGDVVHVVGPPGCGKSITLEQIAIDLEIPFVRFSLGGYLDPANLLGDIQLCDSENGQGIVTYYVKGILAEMAEKGGMIIFDELDQMEPAGNSVFQRITEADGQIVIKTHDKNKPTVVIQRHPMFRMAFTSNTEGHGDVSGMFAGVQQQNQSLLDRINARFFTDYDTFNDYQIMRDDYKLPAGVIKALFGTTTDTKVDPTCLVAEIRAKCKADNGWRTHLTSRMLMDIASHYAAFHGTVNTTTFSWHKTMLFYFLNKFPVHYRKLVQDMIRTKLGSDFEPTNDSDKIVNLGPTLKTQKFFPNPDTFVLPSMMKGK
jgi:hypothetical protein